MVNIKITNWLSKRCFCLLTVLIILKNYFSIFIPCIAGECSDSEPCSGANEECKDGECVCEEGFKENDDDECVRK